MRHLELDPNQAEMIDILLDNAIISAQEQENMSNDDKAELALEIVIRAKLRTAYPEIGEALVELERRIDNLFGGSDESR